MSDETCARMQLSDLQMHDSMGLSPREVGSWRGVGLGRSN